MLTQYDIEIITLKQNKIVKSVITEIGKRLDFEKTKYFNAEGNDKSQKAILRNIGFLQSVFKSVNDLVNLANEKEIKMQKEIDRQTDIEMSFQAICLIHGITNLRTLINLGPATLCKMLNNYQENNQIQEPLGSINYTYRANNFEF
jgi:hypothetical protein